jgi:phage gp16-like protein
MADRKKLIQLVHVGAAKLFPGDDAARRAWQRERTRHESCAAMTIADLENLVAELRRKGALQPKRQYSPARRKPLQSKITAIWIGMGRDGLIRDASEKSLMTWCRRQTGKHSIDWLTNDEASQLLEALKKWRSRMIKEASNEP